MRVNTDWSDDTIKSIDFSNKAKEHFKSQDRNLADWYAAKWLCSGEIQTILTDSHDGRIYVYDYEKGIYSPTGEAELKARITTSFENYARIGSQREILNHVRNLTLVNSEMWNDRTPKLLLPVMNGLLDFNNLELRPHTPLLWYRHCLPVKFDPEASCPMIMQFLREIVEEKDVPRILDLIAMSIYCGHTLEKFWVFVGTGANGKSKLIELISRFVGRENCSTLTLKQLSEDRFAAANTYGKLLNFGADIGSQAIKDTAFLKSYTGGDRVSVQFKHQQPFDMEPTATLVFSANSPPAFYDDSEGMFRRPEVITFPYKFGNEKDVAENPEMRRADPRILEKITTPEEFSGLLNLVLSHLKRILNDGQLSVPHSTSELRKTYLRMSNSVAAFVTESCEPAEYVAADKGPQGEFYPPEGCITAEEFYKAYSSWCTKNNLRPDPEAWVSRRLKAMQGWYLELGQKDHFGSWGSRKRTIRGIRILTRQSRQTQQTQHFPTARRSEEIMLQWKNAGSAVPVVPENQNSPTTGTAFHENNYFESAAPALTPIALLEALRNLGSCSHENLESLFPGEPIDAWLSSLKERGDVLESPAGTYRVLE